MNGVNEPMDAPENPYKPPSSEVPNDGVESRLMTDLRDSKVNMNPKDNLFQIVSMLCGTAVGSFIGPTVVSGPQALGIWGGGFAGLVVALLLSGGWLMVRPTTTHPATDDEYTQPPN